MSQAIFCSCYSEQALLPEAQRGSWKEQIWERFEKEIPFQNNLRKTSRNGRNYLMWVWHTQHSTVFLCTKLILSFVLCDLKALPILSHFFLAMRGLILGPDGIATWTITIALGSQHRTLRYSIFTQKEHQALSRVIAFSVWS